MSVEKSLEGGVADPQLHRCPTPGHFSRGKALQNSSKTTGEATTVRYPGPANPLALSPSPIHPGSHSLPYHLQLELCHRRQKVQQQSSHSRPCAELLSHALESDPQQLPRSQRVVHVLDRPKGPVQPEDHHRLESLPGRVVCVSSAHLGQLMGN